MQTTLRPAITTRPRFGNDGTVETTLEKLLAKVKSGKPVHIKHNRGYSLITTTNDQGNTVEIQKSFGAGPQTVTITVNGKNYQSQSGKSVNLFQQVVDQVTPASVKKPDDSIDF